MRPDMKLSSLCSANTWRKNNFQFIGLLGGKREPFVAFGNKTKVSVSRKIDDFYAVNLQRIKPVTGERIGNSKRRPYEYSGSEIYIDIFYSDSCSPPRHHHIDLAGGIGIIGGFIGK